MIGLVHFEIENLRRVRKCPNIVKLKAVYEGDQDIKIVTSYAGEQTLESFVAFKKLHMEPHAGNQKRDSSTILLEARSFKPVLPEKEIKIIMRQLLSAVAFIHRKNIIHRDIKPENIIIKPEKMKVCLGDFGISCHYNP